MACAAAVTAFLNPVAVSLPDLPSPTTATRSALTPGTFVRIAQRPIEADISPLLIRFLISPLLAASTSSAPMPSLPRSKTPTMTQSTTRLAALLEVVKYFINPSPPYCFSGLSRTKQSGSLTVSANRHHAIPYPVKRILDRYIFREIALTWLGVTLILLMILLTNQFARILGDVAKGKLPKGAAFDVIGLSAAQYLTVLVPIGLFLAVMLALGRLYRDSEMPAMMACRVGPAGIYRPLMWLLVPLSLIVAWLSIVGTPQALTKIERISAEARREADLASIEPGRFTVLGPDQAVIYGESITSDGLMENVFIQRNVNDRIVEVIVAKRGEQVESDDPDTRLLVLHEGRRYEGEPGTARFRVVEFAEHGIPYRLPSPT